MTSDPTTVFVWIWLPGHAVPVVCGRLDDVGGQVPFTYARSYLSRDDAVPIYEQELPLRRGTQFGASPAARLPLCIEDAMPDSWGRRLVEHRLHRTTSELHEFTYLLESSSDRIGALDFQPSAASFLPRFASPTTLEDLAEASERLEDGLPLDPVLEAALLHGTSVGGARPKALVEEGERRMIAKFSSSSDRFPVVQGEFVAMRLAQRCGLDVAPVQLVRVHDRFVLLVERFDREGDARRRLVSALTVLGLNAFPEGRYATYFDLAQQVRASFVEPGKTLRELFGRIAFNMLCGNTDDHGKNHAAIVRSDGLQLSPAYDICPQAHVTRGVVQAMAYAPGQRESNLAALVRAGRIYNLSQRAASAIVTEQISVIRGAWDDVCDEAELTVEQRNAFRGRQFLNSDVLDGF